MIKSVGGVAVKTKHRLSCHCGTVVLELDLPDGIVNPRRCDCSICRRKGAIVASVVLSGITVIQGEDALQHFQFQALLLLHLWHLHPSSTPLVPGSVRLQRWLLGRHQPVLSRASAVERWRQPPSRPHAMKKGLFRIVPQLMLNPYLKRSAND